MLTSNYQSAKLQPTTISVEGLHFPQSASGPVWTAVATIVPLNEDIDHPRFPAVEHVMGARKVTRECQVALGDRQFIIFYQHDDKAQLPNQALKSVILKSDWRGEVLIMARGTKHFVKNLRGKEDKRLAFLAVEGALWLTVLRKVAADGV
ncbi:hypothetical protein HWV62_20878 [Athelia sp. TMB]|nr:hypothetical protein HWV62_20878 [Athelia sp. TMB]